MKTINTQDKFAGMEIFRRKKSALILFSLILVGLLTSCSRLQAEKNLSTVPGTASFPATPAGTNFAEGNSSKISINIEQRGGVYRIYGDVNFLPFDWKSNEEVIYRYCEDCNRADYQQFSGVLNINTGKTSADQNLLWVTPFLDQVNRDDPQKEVYYYQQSASGDELFYVVQNTEGGAADLAVYNRSLNTIHEIDSSSLNSCDSLIFSKVISWRNNEILLECDEKPSFAGQEGVSYITYLINYLQDKVVNLSQLLSDESSDFLKADFSPDGSMIAIVDSENDKLKIYRITDLFSGDPAKGEVNTFAVPDVFSEIHWENSGNKIYYIDCYYFYSFSDSFFDSYSLSSIDVHTGEREKLVDLAFVEGIFYDHEVHSNYGSYDHWELSPDGKKAMIYGSEVWIVDIPQEN